MPNKAYDGINLNIRVNDEGVIESLKKIVGVSEKFVDENAVFIHVTPQVAFDKSKFAKALEKYLGKIPVSKDVAIGIDSGDFLKSFDRMYELAFQKSDSFGRRIAEAIKSGKSGITIDDIISKEGIAEQEKLIGKLNEKLKTINVDDKSNSALYERLDIMRQIAVVQQSMGKFDAKDFTKNIKDMFSGVDIHAMFESLKSDSLFLANSNTMFAEIGRRLVETGSVADALEFTKKIEQELDEEKSKRELLERQVKELEEKIQKISKEKESKTKDTTERSSGSKSKFADDKKTTAIKEFKDATKDAEKYIKTLEGSYLKKIHDMGSVLADAMADSNLSDSDKEEIQYIYNVEKNKIKETIEKKIESMLVEYSKALKKEKKALARGEIAFVAKSSDDIYKQIGNLLGLHGNSEYGISSELDHKEFSDFLSKQTDDVVKNTEAILKEEIRRRINSAKNDLKSSSAKLSGSGEYKKEFTKSVSALESAIKEIDTFFQSLIDGTDTLLKANNKGRMRFDQSKLSRLSSLLDTLDITKTALKGADKQKVQKTKSTKSKKELVDSLLDIKNFEPRAARAASKEIDRLLTRLDRLKDTDDLSGITREVDELTTSLKKANKVGKTLIDVVGEKAWYGFAQQIGTLFSLNDAIRYAREAIDIVRELDTAYTEMRKVSDESVSSLLEYQKMSFDIASGIGTTAVQIQNSTADFLRIGESLTEASESAKTANILLNVSEFDTIDEATTSLIAMSRAYSDFSKMQIVDKLNEIGNNYAISTDQLATSMEKSAATLSLMGNTIDETAAMITTANAIIQDADSVAAGLRTISLRLIGTKEAKEELAVLGEEVDSFVTSTESKKRQIIKNYTSVASNDYKGFDILDENGNYKNTYEILLGIADIYQEIVELDKKLGTNKAKAIIEELAGKNRSNIAAAILQDPNQLRSVKESSVDSEGSAEEELDKYLDSIEGKLSVAQTRIQELSYNILSTDFINDAITGFTKLVEVIDHMATSIEKINGLFTGGNGAFGGLGMLAGFASNLLGIGKSYCKAPLFTHGNVIMLHY